MSQLDLNKPVQTRDGRAARIICTDRKSYYYPIIAFIKEGETYEQVRNYTVEGLYCADATSTTRHDLVNVPERTSRFLNVYISGDDCRQLSLTQAKRNALHIGNTIELVFEGHNLVEVIHHG